MKKIVISTFGLFIVLLTMSYNPDANNELAIGAKIPKADKNMADVSGKEISLGSAKTAKGLLVIFSCNTCPYVHLSESRIKEYTDLCTQKGIGAVLVNSNEAQRGDGEDDNLDAMKKYYAEQKLACYYTVDVKSEIAD